MAFPTIQTADTKNGTQTSNSTSWTITYPTNLAAGDLILMFVGVDGAPGAPTLPADWVNKENTSNGASALQINAKISLGTETGTFTYNPGASEQGGWRVFRITGWFGGSLGTAGGHDGDGLDQLASAVGSPNANPNPPNLDPGQWGTEDTLWFASCGIDTSRTISVFPLAGNNSSDVSGGAGGATLGLCTTTSAVGSLDPGTFTCSASDDWVAATVAVRPTGAAVPRYGFVNHQEPGIF